MLADPTRLAPIRSTWSSCATCSSAATSRSARRVHRQRQRFTGPPDRRLQHRDVRNLIIRPGVRVGDVADVALVAPELTQRRHMDGRNAVGIDVFKSTQANIVDVADRVMAAVEEARRVPQLQGVQILVIENQATASAARSSELRNAPA